MIQHTHSIFVVYTMVPTVPIVPEPCIQVTNRPSSFGPSFVAPVGRRPFRPSVHTVMGGLKFKPKPKLLRINGSSQQKSIEIGVGT